MNVCCLNLHINIIIELNIFAEGGDPNIPLGEVGQPFEEFGNFTPEDIFWGF